MMFPSAIYSVVKMERASVMIFLSLLILGGVCFTLVSYSCVIIDLSDGRFCSSTTWVAEESIFNSTSLAPHYPVSENTTPYPALLSSYAVFDVFTISPSTCSNTSSPFLLLIIFSRPSAFERRKTIRETFGSVQRNCSKEVHILFVIGQVPNGTVQLQLLEEARLQDDIIQSAAFEDGYGQATRKGVSLLHWSLLHCPFAQFVAKADDDCWVNIPHFLKLLHRNRDERKVLGLFWAKGAPVIRDPKNKWVVSREDYPDDRFPPYVSGILYAFHRDIVNTLTKAAMHLKYLWHDDVFLTGLVPRAAHIGHVALAGYDVVGRDWNKPCSKMTHLAIHYVDDEKMKRLWNDSCFAYSIAC